MRFLYIIHMMFLVLFTFTGCEGQVEDNYVVKTLTFDLNSTLANSTDSNLKALSMNKSTAVSSTSTGINNLIFINQVMLV